MLLIILFFAACSFIFSAAETSIVGLSKIRLRHMVAKGVKRVKHVQNLASNLDKLIIAILVGNNFVNIAISSLVTVISINLFGYNWGVVISTFATTMFVLIFCEITPKILAIKHTEKIALLVAPLMEVFIRLFRHIINFFTKTSNLILHILRIETPKRSPLITEEELRLMIEVGKEEGVLSDEERKMLHRIFEFGDIKLCDVMVLKEKIIAANINSTYEELLDIFAEEGHARLPVYDGSIDNIIGIIYARDLLYIMSDKGLFVLQDLLHKPHYVPATLRVNELLRRFQTDKIQIAIVVDEHEKTLGLVTLEDLVEEIVGEIEEAPANHTLNKN
ncbi:MAG: hemolysin family protein [Candidatus Omnitrophica bacterium]|nr:hemolysin family protein [Candidatus Omnitrophota bacterium]